LQTIIEELVARAASASQYWPVSVMTKPSILRKLEDGDRRSIGRSNEVVAKVLAERKLFSDLFAGLSFDDPVVRARGRKLLVDPSMLQ
jgi:hypothetical protein